MGWYEDNFGTGDPGLNSSYSTPTQTPAPAPVTTVTPAPAPAPAPNTTSTGYTPGGIVPGSPAPPTQQPAQQPQPQQDPILQQPPQGSQLVQQPQQPQQQQAKPYQTHVNWFGSPQAYAQTILQKMQSGVQFDDPAAAQAFMQDYPQYFAQQQPQQPPTQNQQQFETPFQVQEIQESPYASQVQSLMSQLQSQVNQPFNYNPQSDPAYQSMVQSVTQSVAEQMASRGILNSTVTRDQVAQSISQAVPQLMQFAYQRYQGQINGLLSTMTNLMKMDNDWQSQQRQSRQDQFAQQKYADEQKRQQYLDLLAVEKEKVVMEEKKVKAALDRVKEVGYVDNQSSVVLGIPVGTPSYRADKDARDRLLKLQMKEMDIEAAMQRTQVQQAGATARTQYTQGQVNARQKTTNATPSDKTTQQAITFAQRDPKWNMPGTDRDSLILEYQNRLRQGSGFNSFPGNEDEIAGGAQNNAPATGQTEDVSSLIQQARDNGYDDSEIADSLREDGINPADYGL